MTRLRLVDDEPEEKEHLLTLSVRHSNQKGAIELQAQEENGTTWLLLTIYPNGTTVLAADNDPETGLIVDDEGHLIVRREADVLRISK